MSSDLKSEVKQLIIDVLNLEDIEPKDIVDSAPLFVDGLGLDSIDSLELGVALKKKYNITISADDKAVQKHFESLNTLVDFIESNRS